MKDIPTSPRIAQIKRNRRMRRLRLILLYLALFISIIIVASYFSSYPKIVINNIEVKGNSIIDADKLVGGVKEKIYGKYFKLFSRSNFLIYPRNSIYKDLILNFPRIESLSIKRQGFNTLSVNIVERAGSYLYCGLQLPEKLEDIGENCYFVNNDGYIFDKAPYFSGDVYFKYYTKIDGDFSKPQGSQVFSPSRFHELARFMDGIVSLGFKPAYLVVDSNGLHSLYLKSVNKNSSPKIIFKTDNDLLVILDNFSTAMGEKEFANEINSKYDTLSYIDLRFKNKVLYKFE